MNQTKELQDHGNSKIILFSLINDPACKTYKKLCNNEKIVTEIKNNKPRKKVHKPKRVPKLINKYLSLLYKEDWLLREGIRRKYAYSINKRKFVEYFFNQIDISYLPPDARAFSFTKDLTIKEKKSLTELYFREFFIFFSDVDFFFNHPLYEFNNLFVDDLLQEFELEDFNKKSITKYKITNNTYLNLHLYKRTLTYNWTMKKPEILNHPE